MCRFADREAFLAGSHDTSLAKAHAAYADDSGVEALEPAMPTPIIALLKSINLETADGRTKRRSLFPTTLTI